MATVDDYLKLLGDPQKSELQRVRRTIASAAPDAIEVISYGMPGFRYKNKYLIAYAAFKNHMSIFPGSEAVEAFKQQLSAYALSRGTIQFTLENPLPDKILVEITKYCMKRIESEAK